MMDKEIREVLDTLCAVAKARDLSKSPTGFDDDIDNALFELQELGVVLKVEIPDGWLLVKPNGKPAPYEGYTGVDVNVLGSNPIIALTESLIEVCSKCKEEPCACSIDRGSFAKYV